MEVLLIGIQFIFGAIFFVIGVAIYLIPTIIAHKKNHPHKIPIILVNVLLGWILVGWVISLIWCFLTPSDFSMNSQGKTQDVAAEIEKLSSLKDKGILTDEEFQQKKEILLSKI